MEFPVTLRWTSSANNIQVAYLGACEVGRVNAGASAYLLALGKPIPLWQSTRTVEAAKRAIEEAVQRWIAAAGLRPAALPAPPASEEKG